MPVASLRRAWGRLDASYLKVVVNEGFDNTREAKRKGAAPIKFRKAGVEERRRAGGRPPLPNVRTQTVELSETDVVSDGLRCRVREFFL